MRKGNMVIGILLLVIGVVLLFKELGLVQWEQVKELARMWPVLLIFWGLDILIPKKLLWLEVILILAIIALILLLAFKHPLIYREAQFLSWTGR